MWNLDRRWHIDMDPLRGKLRAIVGRPLRSRVVSDVEVQNPAPSMLDHEKAVEHPECHCRHREEIERRNHLTMILQECQPALGTFAARRRMRRRYRAILRSETTRPSF